LRTLGTVGRLALALALGGGAIAACGTSPRVHVAASHQCLGGRVLTVYAGLPLSGPDSFGMASLVGGARIALYAAHKREGPCIVQLRPFDDAGASGVWDPGLTNQIAQRASSDPGAVAYIGDFDSGATATSLQTTNASNTLQLSPWSPYVGFTDPGPADDEGDPQRYQSSGRNTFARLVPSDYNQAAAAATFMADQGVTRLFVLGDVSDPFDADIAQLIANRSELFGVPVVGYKPNLNLETNTQPQGYAGVATEIAAARADAVVLGGRPGAGALALWTELHTMLPHAKLFAPSTLATPDFLSHLGAAASVTYVTSPILEWSQYPPAAARIKRGFCRRHGVCPNQFALYGYEAMRDVLLAIQRSGWAASSPKLLHAFFHLGARHGVIGDYTIFPDGNTSLKTFDGYHVTAGGRLAFVTAIALD
jgi:branched-chain amino acid transport system substrate-binding protein